MLLPRERERASEREMCKQRERESGSIATVNAVQNPMSSLHANIK